jgi:hypothetical protein
MNAIGFPAPTRLHLCFAGFYQAEPLTWLPPVSLMAGLGIATGSSSQPLDIWKGHGPAAPLGRAAGP